MVRQTTLNTLLKNIDTLIASPKVHGYVIGYTKNFKSRASNYKSTAKFPYMYALAIQLEKEHALDLEEALFRSCTKNKKSLRYKKYQNEKRDSPYHRSAGGDQKDSKNCTVYIACF